ncbi:D-alanyl-D-alanine carboxypeptidase/D-alanyl-D-alanine endopeptidase [Phycicoccus sonneratiae]|uniref:D-alanyl-D-alanine carboxypeptidase/D-alanyl-D-alanine-endopeptidase n=1 Tax=Phycicoccus sonneratiae TaxID=2807628 RepID=A0ABS2CPA4_9MICO|nr:D-alanyl-D-alanine carboxypeptidase/D-alanyl-D-alanine-endopeptidase [Phycicoccus sonneraticus]MBM6401620.1 D-alanyl-D-alanine carboxypeptidase/D-alanyl-D-alanine-endopeptidase [Phycicoccus sonneraticus]
MPQLARSPRPRSRTGRTRSMRTALVAALGLALLGLAPAATAGTHAATLPPGGPRPVALAPVYALTSADTRMASALTSRATTARFGASFSGTVFDSVSNRVIWTKNPTTALMPASTTKLVTAHNALTVFGPSYRFTTTVRSGPNSNQAIIQGSGDPSLTSADIDRLATTTAAVLKSRGVTSARVYADDDVFPTPTLAPGWKSSYVPDSITPVRGLVRDQRDVADTSVDVGTYFRDRVRAHGIPTVSYIGRGNAATDASVMASSQGAPLSDIVSRMLLNSDNEIAEALHKIVGIKKGKGSSWTGARSAQSSVLTGQGLSASALYDGSGLSRSDRLSSLQLARVVDRGLNTDYSALAPMRSAAAIPTAGRTGTLAAKYSRFTTAPSSCAAGKVWAKTGTLNDVVSLAGFTVAKDGRVKVFAFVVNGKTSSTTLKKDVDMLAATVNGCY